MPHPRVRSLRAPREGSERYPRIASARILRGAMSERFAGLKLHLSSPSFAFLTCEGGGSGLAVWLWGRGTTLADTQTIGLALRDHVANKERAATLIWLTGLPESAPSDEVRDALVHMIAKVPRGFVALSYLVEAEGFASAVARSVVTGLNLRARPTIKVGRYEELAPALTELAGALGWAPDTAAHLHDELLEARRAWARAGGTALA